LKNRGGYLNLNLTAGLAGCQRTQEGITAAWMNLQMFGERWNRILQAQGDATALTAPRGGTLPLSSGKSEWTFSELDREARRLQPEVCPRLGRFYLAQGDGLQITVALLAGFLTGLPVQVVEADRTRRVPKRKAPKGTALVKQTVGSSGHRRCQFFSFAQIAADVDRLYHAMALHDCGVSVAAVSVAHSYGLTTTLLPMLLHGLPVHWLPTPFPGGVAEALARHERAFLPAVPAIWKAWLVSGLDLSRVKLAVSAGSPLTPALEQQVRERLGLKLHNLYGASECGAISYDAYPGPRSSPIGMGRLLPGVTATVSPEGRLLVQSDAVGLGYDEPLPGEVFGNGRHLTWDEVHLTPAGLDFLGCVGTGINVASRKLSPDEIAERIRAATGIRRLHIHGDRSRDSERVQDIVASLDLPATELTAAFKAKACAALAPWEVPRRWHSERSVQPEERRQISPVRDALEGFDDSGALPAV
jgi:hypothetical protein